MIDYTSIAYWGAMAVAAGSLAIISLVILCKCCCHNDDVMDSSNKTTTTVTVIQLNAAPQTQNHFQQHGYGPPPTMQGYDASTVQGQSVLTQPSMTSGIQLQDARPPPYVPQQGQTLEERPLIGNATAPPASMSVTLQRYLNPRSTPPQYIEENELTRPDDTTPPEVPTTPRPSTLNRNVDDRPPDLPTTARPRTLDTPPELPNSPRPNALARGTEPPELPNSPRPNALARGTEPPEVPTSARPNSLTRRSEEYLPDENAALDYNYVEPNPGPNNLAITEDYLDPSDLNEAYLEPDNPNSDYIEPIAGPGEQSVTNSQYNYASDSHNDGVTYY